MRLRNNQEPPAVLFESDSTTPEYVISVNIRLFVLSRHYHVYVSSETISVSISLTQNGALYRRRSRFPRWRQSWLNALKVKV
jgi:hypothetical protein